MRVPHAVELPFNAVVSGQPVVRVSKAIEVVVIVVIFAAVLVGGVPHDVSVGVALLPMNHDQVVVLLGDADLLRPLLAVVPEAGEVRSSFRLGEVAEIVALEAQGDVVVLPSPVLAELLACRLELPLDGLAVLAGHTSTEGLHPVARLVLVEEIGDHL